MSKISGRVGGSTLLASKHGKARAQGVSSNIGITDYVPANAFGNLQDNFTTLDTAVKWSGTYGTVTLSSGRASIETSTNYSGLWSQSTWMMINTGIYAQLTPPPANGATSNYVYLEMDIIDMDISDRSTNLAIYLNSFANTISFSDNVAFNDAGRVTITYNATSHAWCRIRHAVNTIYWDTSPDGITWTNQRSKTAPAWIGKTNNALAFQSHRDNGTTNAAFVDNVNVLS